MDASTAAILGAAIGATGGLGGGLLTLFTQTRHLNAQHQAEHTRWSADMRRETYTALLTATKQLSNILWKASDQLHEPTATATDWHTAFRDVHDAWTHFSAASAAVSLAGPHAVAASADRLRHAMNHWEMLSGAWIRTAIREETGQLQDYETRFVEAANAKKPLEEAFQLAARKALGTEA
ncbi:hypothetical protein [Streptomyces sp. NPDC058695]|uniref:hypothetical protein n=1 Tax=Streptomyces sp. NPDC058695 TaxID=3346604 RepID=UPI003647D9E8